MKKKIIFLFLSVCSFAQVGINTSSPTNTIDVDGTARVRSIEEVTTKPTYVLTPDDNGVIQKVNSSIIGSATSSDGVSRFIGGQVLLVYNNTTLGTLDPSYLIGGAEGTSYTMGTLTATSKVGGIIKIYGTGFKVSNPGNGYVDIIFDTPMNTIFGISSNIKDTYINANSVLSNFREGTPNTQLYPTDNTQISYSDNKGIRIKTGNSSLTNRSFTFLITGN